MEAFGLYLLKSVIWLIGFALVYFLFLRNERFFFLNRIFLLAGILISIVFPFISIHYIVNLPLTSEFQTGTSSATVVQEAKAVSFLDLKYLLGVLYAAGVVFIASGLIKQSRAVIKTINKSIMKTGKPVKLIRTSDYSGSFSFFSWVFVNPSISDRETREILNHELAHIRQRHWFDLVLGQFLCTVQWFNPVVWIYIRFIRQNHEYLADEVALQRTSDPAVYKATLLNQIVGIPVISLSNSFNYSLNKKRFTMMKNIISSPYRKMKILFILPVFAIVLYAFAEPEYSYEPIAVSAIAKVSYPDLQTKEVKGIIKESEAKPLQGATVVIKGTTTGTTTDSKGSFKLADVPENGSLVISYVGFKTKVVKPVFNSEMSIQMVRDTVTLTLGVVGMPPPPPPPAAGFKVGFDGVSPPPMIIVNGLVSDLKIEQIDPNTIESINVIKDESAKVLYGDKGENGVLEIMLKPATKMPDPYAPITVNGYKTGVKKEEGIEIKNYDEGILGNPLIIIDGVVSEKKNLESMNPNDVESMNVLKGIRATDKYGDKAREGAIEVSTKKKNFRTKSDLNEVTVVGYGSKQKMVVIEKMPMFPGGEEAMQAWIADNLKFPEDAAKNKGEVTVSFTVDKTGKVTDVKVIKSSDPLLDKEAIRVVKSMPEWKPGSQNGTNVNVNMLVDVKFFLK